MSLYSRPVAYFGIYFSNFKELEDFLEQHNLEVEEDLYTDMLGYTHLNCITGEGFALGYKMTLGDTIEKYQKQWDNELGHLDLVPTAKLDIITF